MRLELQLHFQIHRFQQSLQQQDWVRVWVHNLQKGRGHALFASYGPIPEPNLVVVVIVENGESGSAVAAPIAKKLIEEYQNEKKNEQTNPS